MPTFVRQLAGFLAAALLAQSAPAQEPIWHYSPYQIHVWVALAPAPELNAALERDILRTLRERAEAIAPASWSLTAEPAPPAMRGVLLAGLEWLTVEQLVPAEAKPEPVSESSSASSFAVEAVLPVGDAPIPEADASPRPDFTELLDKTDKLVLVRVVPERGGFAVEARELDSRTRQWSEIAVRRAGHASLIPLEAFRAVAAVFRPLARVERVTTRDATVRLRAGGLVTEEADPAFLPDDRVLLPVVRFNDRYGRPRPNGIQIAPWTFLTFRERAGVGRVECDLVAGVGAPLGGRTSSRIEKYGLAIPALHEKTDVIVRARPLSRTDPEPPQPLNGYEIYERLPDVEDLVFVARTDWRGQVEIEKTDRPLRLLYVKNGSRMLAKFPVVPGWKPQVEVFAMNDDRRLEVEGFVSGLQGRVMDLVVAREVLAARIRKRIGDKKFDEATALLGELRALPTRDQVQADLNREEARQRLLPTDRATKAQIDKLFADTRNLIGKYLDATLAITLQQELTQAQSGG